MPIVNGAILDGRRKWDLSAGMAELAGPGEFREPSHNGYSAQADGLRSRA